MFAKVKIMNMCWIVLQQITFQYAIETCKIKSLQISILALRKRMQKLNLNVTVN